MALLIPGNEVTEKVWETTQHMAKALAYNINDLN